MTKRAAWMAMGCIATLMLGKPANADLFFDEDFPDDGQLTTESIDWVGYSSTGANPVQVVNGAAVIDGRDLPSGGEEDVSRSTGSVLGDGQTWYYGARFTLEDIHANNSWNPVYVMGFRADDIGFVIPLTARLYISTSADSAKYSLGISSFGPENSGQIKPWATDLSFGTTYTAIVSYTSHDGAGGTTADGYSTLWIDPETQASTSVTDNMPSTTLLANTLNDDAFSVFLRQPGGLVGTPKTHFDDVAAGTTFNEVLIALGGAAPTGDADFDADGDVDGADFLTWQRGVGTGGGQPQGNADGLGDIDGDDLAIWKAQFGPSSPAQPVPEPATLALAMFSLAAVAGAVRRKA